MLTIITSPLSETEIFIISMWSKLPFDLLSIIFSFLSPDSLARARSTCRNWYTCTKAYPLTPTRSTTSWFLAMPIRNHRHRPCCYAHNPVTNNWHELSLEFLPVPTVRPVATIGSLLLLRVTNNSTMFQLALCNPFTREFRYLPRLQISRTNPAAGVTILESNHGFLQFPHFRVYVAGGMSEAAQGGGATYETTVEMYDSKLDTWQIEGSMPVEFAVRLTVWTPNENVCIEGTLYWITSARAYSVMGFDVSTNTWRELGVPMAERLEFATLVRRNGALALVGGTCGEGACIWEMNEGDKWCLVDKVPAELGLRLLCGKRNWDCIKCVGHEDVICLYGDLGSGMVVCKKVGDMSRWEWVWVDGCGYIKGKRVHNCSIRGSLVHPTLASSHIF